MHPNREYILNYGVDLLTKNEGLDFIAKKIIENKGVQVVTINPEMIEMGEKNEELGSILKSADLVIPDGFGIKLALKLRGINQEQIPGIEFARELINICAENDYSVGFLGAKEEVLTTAIANIKAQTPNLKVAFQKNGYYSNEESIIDEILTVKPKVLLVALGVPKQEFLIDKIKSKNNDIILIGVGGSFDVWAGYVERAPKSWQNLGLEWLYRTIKQPERIKRIFPTLPMFLFKVIIENMQIKRMKSRWQNLAKKI